jgi:hypothetical protein
MTEHDLLCHLHGTDTPRGHVDCRCDFIGMVRDNEHGRLLTSVREDVFNEVIYGLGILLGTTQQMSLEHRSGVWMSLEYVKAMQAAEA